MFVGFIKPTDGSKQITDVVFNASLEAFVSGFAKVKTRRRVFNEREVYIIGSMFDSTKPIENVSEAVMKIRR